MDEQNYGMPEQQNLQNQQIAHQQAWDQQMQAGQMAQQQMWQQQEAHRMLWEQQQMAQQSYQQTYNYDSARENDGLNQHQFTGPYMGQNGPVTPQNKPPIEPSEKSHKGLIIAILCIVLAAGLGVGAYFLFFHKSGNDTEDLTEAEKVAKEYYIAWTNYDEDGMKKCFDGSMIITDHTQEDEYMETGYWITYSKDANVHAWADYSEPNEGLSGDHTVYCTIEADITGQGDPARSPDTGKVKSETFAMIQKNGKWYIAKNEQPKMKETWTDYGTGTSTEENTEASTLAPDITPEETDIESAQAIYNAVNTMMADEEMFIKVNEYAGDDKPVLYLSCIAGEPFGSKSEINVGGVASEVNKLLGGPTRSIYGIYKDGIIPTKWGVVYDPVTAKNRVYAVTGTIDNGYKGIQLAPDQKSEWEVLTTGSSSTEEVTESTTEPSSNSISNESWIDFNDMHFYIKGKKYTLGKSTLQDLINDGVPFNDKSKSMFENSISRNTESSGYQIVLGEYWNAQVMVLNNTAEDKKASECVISSLFYNAKKDSSQDILTFDFPVDVSTDVLLSSLSEPDDKYHYDDGSGYVSDRYTWQKESEQYIGYKKYNFEYVNGKLNGISLYWK